MQSMRPAVFAVALVAALTLPATSQAKKCPADSVQVGDVCVDKYEASVWSTTDAATIKKIQKGKIATTLDLLLATQHGVASDDYGAGCADTGTGCVDYYAVSIVGVTPSAYINWFQATAACRNAAKHLATNQEWQAAALGTPDTGGADNGTTDCNTDSTLAVANTGSRSSCLSDAGAFDTVGNLYEWVADWVPRSTACPGWGGFSNDDMCLSGASTTANGPGALIRGGYFSFGSGSGPFTVNGDYEPWNSGDAVGFRCARRL
jgi:hypothetical protein